MPSKSTQRVTFPTGSGLAAISGPPAETISRCLSSRVLVGGFVLWTFLSLCFPLSDTDFWWHLKTGELIVQEARIPQVDWYTFTDSDKPWIDLHWGFQILIAGLYHLGGANLVVLVKAAVITGAIAMAWRAAGEGRLPDWGKSALWILPVICVSGRAYERPEMVSQFFLAAWLWIVRYSAVQPRLIWLLPVIQLVWVNCHALFVLGLVVGTCFILDDVARGLARGRWGLALPAAHPSGPAIFWTGALVLAACFANPFFEEGAFFPLTLYRKFTVDQWFYSKWVAELVRPIDMITLRGWSVLKNPYLMAELGLWCVTAGSFVWLYWRRRRWSVLRLFLFTAFSHLAWEAERNTNFFALVAGFTACENIQQGLAIEDRSPLPRPGRSGASYGTWGMTAVVAGLIVAVVTGLWNSIGHSNKPFGLGDSRERFIHGAAKFAGQEGFPRRAFVSEFGQAAVYIYHNAPARRVFMDGRLEVCSLNTFETYIDILAQIFVSDRAWERVFQQPGEEMPVVILDTRMSLPQIRGLLATPGWRMVFVDSSAAVFLSDAQADRLSLAAVSPSPLLERALDGANSQR